MQEKSMSSEQDSDRPWYQMDEAAVLEALGSSHAGLGPETVRERQQRFGVNELLDSVLLTMPLMMEAKEKGLLEAPPRSSQARIIDALFLRRVLLIGPAIALPGALI